MISKIAAVTIKVFAVTSVLSGCDSTTSELGIDHAPQPDSPTFNQMNNEFDELGMYFGRYSYREHIPDQLPVSGSLTYQGVMNISEHAAEQILGQAVLNVDFSNNSINGAFTNFKGDDGTAYQGYLAMNNGTVSTTEILGEISGSLTSDSRHSQTVDAYGTMAGHFGGRDNVTHIFANNLNINWVTNAGMATEETREMGGQIRAYKDY